MKLRVPRSTVLVVADQAVNSATNFALTAIIAANASTIEFGAFAVVQISVLLVQGVAQPASGDILLRSRAQAVPALFVPGSRLIWRMALVLAAGGAAASAVTGSPIVAMGSAVAACTVLIDYHRSFFIAARHFKRALIMDLLYGASQTTIGLALVLASTSAITSELATGAWLAAGVIGLLAGRAFVRDVRRQPRPTVTPGKILSVRYAAESLAVSGSSQIAQLVAVQLLGVGFAAGLRGASLVLGPIALALQMSRFILIPSFSRLAPRRGRRLAQRSAGGLFFLTLLIGVAVYAGLHHFGHVLLGESADIAQLFFPIVAMMYASQTAYSIMFYFHRAQQQDTIVSFARVLQVAILVVGSVAMLTLTQELGFLIVLALSPTAAAAVMLIARPRLSQVVTRP
ncbi:hypothetical protein [Modestobacter sp. SYSU DS0290]